MQYQVPALILLRKKTRLNRMHIIKKSLYNWATILLKILKTKAVRSKKLPNQKTAKTSETSRGRSKTRSSNNK